jgi:hypothetical protein
MDKYPAFPKIPRWYRDVTISEKIDGTNGQIYIYREPIMDGDPKDYVGVNTAPDGPQFGQFLKVSAGSRNRWITPDKDNYGFAKWVYANAEALAESLGEGSHFGEWWGQGIQRRYGLTEKRFSLFNTHRWADVDQYGIPGLDVVPTLFVGTLTDKTVEQTIDRLDETGSKASPGFMNPEGVVIYHHASGQYFKATLDNDAEPKNVRAVA